VNYNECEISGYNPEDGGSIVLRNVGIVPHHYTVSQSRRRLNTQFFRLL